ncbi:MAG: hypothetical protein A3C51_01660 [Omnitrophica bacterium RIFCSPHIGHO2_02_FULL_46_20]|nr:MAG: hypothetical protein A3C51_01660 [Omnitrophica bacterium RIFCSPHIGHO2_02_FULL_46_20]
MTSLKKKNISGIQCLTLIAIIIIASNIINILLGEPSKSITRLIDMDTEANIPTWFSSILLFIAAFFAYRCSFLSKTHQNGKTIWQVLSLWLLVMSCDEVATIHEQVGFLINKYIFKFSRPGSHTWLLMIGPLAVIIVLSIGIKIKKYLNDSTKAARLLIIGALIYFFGSIVLESTLGFLSSNHLDILRRVEAMLEESFEMVGVIIFISGLMEHNKFLKTIYDIT